MGEGAARGNQMRRGLGGLVRSLRFRKVACDRLSEENARLRNELSENERLQGQISRVAREWTATFDAIPDFVSVHDASYRILRINMALAKFLGHHPSALVGKHCYELLHGRNEPWPDCPHARTMEKREPVTQEVVDPHFGIPVLITCSPFFDQAGNLVGTVHVARDISGQKKADDDRETLIAQLQQALSTVRMLSGILPICCSCKKIRDEDGDWGSVESYIRSHSEAEFSHGICPECMKTLYPEMGR